VAACQLTYQGLGVRQVSSLAIPAFIASAASTTSLQDVILANSSVVACPFLQTCLDTWEARHGHAPTPLPPKQAFWDRPGILLDRLHVESALTNSQEKAAFLAAAAPHSGDWMLALPISSCGLCLDDEAVRVAVSLRLGLDLCAPHLCPCGAQVDAKGIHSLVCKRAPGKTSRHHHLNDVIARAFTAAGVPTTKEPNGLSRSDGKRPDGMTLIPWQRGKSALWDVTVACTSADSYITSSTRCAGATAELAATRKNSKYNSLMERFLFFPIAVETHGPLNAQAVGLLTDLGRRITTKSGEPRETAFLFQRVSVAVQQFNSVLVRDSFVVDAEPE